jgi:uncharacterized protein YjcR
MARVRESEFVFGYDGVGAALGVSGQTIKRWQQRDGFKLTKWTGGMTSSVYLSKYMVEEAKRRYFASKPLHTRRRALRTRATR